MHETDFYLSNSQPINSVKTFPLVIEKAIFNYPAYNTKSLIAMLSHSNTIHTFKQIFFGTKI
jgi:hypothetical protein